ncbi:MAG: site-2 protease family protein [Planctomycetes bacterium]|nr:site-2 protease family protein [Planctomycetota bacterium]
MNLLNTTTNLLLIIFGFGVLIFVHELGHFLAAKWAGIRTEVFAIGMGQAIISWRRGIGLVWGSTRGRVVAKTGKAPDDLGGKELARYGLGETEYSLRWLPIGGFVKMLGQEDINPNAVSADPRSYNVCPIGKRMVVVSAGVVANVLLAVGLFIVAFMIGVRSEAPVVGEVARSMPAGTTADIDATDPSAESIGLKPGDRITYIEGEPVETFADIRIAAAMAKPGQTLKFTVQRAGVSAPLEFLLTPEKDPGTGLLGIGVYPARSSTLLADDDGRLTEMLVELGLFDAGVRPGMRLVSAGGQRIETYEQFQEVVRQSGGRPVPTAWTASGDGPDFVDQALVRTDVDVTPIFQILRYATAIPGVEQNIESGLFGLTPLVKIVAVVSGRNKPNRKVLEPGDVILRAGAVDGPRMAGLKAELATHKSGEIDLLLLRDGARLPVKARVDRKGKLNIVIDWAWELPLIAQPMDRLRTAPGPDGQTTVQPTPVADWFLFGRTRIDAVNDTPVSDWASFRQALRTETRSALNSGAAATVTLTITHPTPNAERETIDLVLAAKQVAALHDLSWRSELPGSAFEPIYTTLSAGGNPLRAVTMGFVQTHKFIVMTYLTLDRLLRGSIGVEQLHGPVGIVHIGARIADRGFTYLIFFLAIISVNLAVINFLPIPIVDGGLFLFLVYEKLKGRAPSPAFQNAATIVGLAFIATVLLVVTWNDLTRLLS